MYLAQNSCHQILALVYYGKKGLASGRGEKENQKSHDIGFTLQQMF